MKQSRTSRTENAGSAGSKNNSNRILTAIVGIPITVLFIYLGKTAFFIGTMFIFLASVFEFFRLINLKIKRRFFLLITGVAYISLVLSLNLTYALPAGKQLVLFIFIGTWSFDTAAYYIGSLWGEHKIAPNISPNKSLEGLLAGIAAVLIVAIYLPQKSGMVNIAPVIKLTWAFALSISAFAGDLIESKLKRLLLVKDSSRILPGHGGFLDRFDSLIASSFVSYLIFRCLL